MNIELLIMFAKFASLILVFRLSPAVITATIRNARIGWVHSMLWAISMASFVFLFFDL